MENQGDLANLILMGSVAITTIIASIKYNKTKEEIKTSFTYVHRKLFDKLNQLSETEIDENLIEIVNSFRNAYNEGNYPSIREWYQAKRLMEKYGLK